MSSELAPITDTSHDEGGINLPARMEYARALAVSNLLPKSYQGQPANVLLAIEFGHALGIPPIQAMQDIHVIEGRPSASANLMASLVRRAGHKLRVDVDEQNLVATATIIRADDPDYEFVARWDMKRAQTAGLTGRGTWKAHPAQMLRNRAISDVCKMGASDALYGVHYTPDELDDASVSAGRPSKKPKVTAAQILGDDLAPQEPAAEYVEAEPDAETGELPIDEPKGW